MPILRSSSVQAVRIVVNSMLPLFKILPEVFSKWSLNSPSLRSCWRWRSDDCREQITNQNENLNQLNSWTNWFAIRIHLVKISNQSRSHKENVLTDPCWIIAVQNQTERLNVEVKLHCLHGFFLLFTTADWGGLQNII